MASLKLVRSPSHVFHLTVGSKPLHPDKKMSAWENVSLKLNSYWTHLNLTESAAGYSMSATKIASEIAKRKLQLKITRVIGP